MALVFPIFPADKTHQVIPHTLLFQTSKLHQMRRMLNASRFLSWFLRQRYPLVLSQGPGGVSNLRAFSAEMCAADGAVDGCNVLFILIAWNNCL